MKYLILTSILALSLNVAFATEESLDRQNFQSVEQAQNLLTSYQKALSAKGIGVRKENKNDEDAYAAAFRFLGESILGRMEKVQGGGFKYPLRNSHSEIKLPSSDPNKRNVPNYRNIDSIEHRLKLNLDYINQELASSSPREPKEKLRARKAIVDSLIAHLPPNELDQLLDLPAVPPSPAQADATGASDKAPTAEE